MVWRKTSFLIIKLNRSTNFSIYSWNENLHVSGSSSVHHQAFFHCIHSNGTCHAGLLTACEQDQDGRPDHAHKLSANLYGIHHCCVYSEKTPDDGQRNYPKHVEFYSKNKFEKLVHLFGFIIRIYHDARSRELQNGQASKQWTWS